MKIALINSSADIGDVVSTTGTVYYTTQQKSVKGTNATTGKAYDFKTAFYVIKDGCAPEDSIAVKYTGDNELTKDSVVTLKKCKITIWNNKKQLNTSVAEVTTGAPAMVYATKPECKVAPKSESKSVTTSAQKPVSNSGYKNNYVEDPVRQTSIAFQACIKSACERYASQPKTSNKEIITLAQDLFEAWKIVVGGVKSEVEVEVKEVIEPETSGLSKVDSEKLTARATELNLHNIPKMLEAITTDGIKDYTEIAALLDKLAEKQKDGQVQFLMQNVDMLVKDGVIDKVKYLADNGISHMYDIYKMDFNALGGLNTDLIMMIKNKGAK